MDTHNASETPSERKHEPSSSSVEIVATPPTWKVVCVTIPLCFQLLCASLDYTILGTAIPSIVDHFHSPNDIGWYSSSYLVTACAVILLWGKVYAIAPVKWTYLTSVLLFQLGSLVCGLSPSSPALIAGRAIAGLGDGGQLPGVMLIITIETPEAMRPLFMGIAMSVYTFGGVIGPLLGGVFTDRLTWRWCFFINIPFGLVTVVMILLLLPSRPAVDGFAWSRRRLMRLDPLGNFLLTSSILCFLFAIDCGGSQYSWADVRVIVLFAVAGCLLALFGLAEYVNPGEILLPARIVKNGQFLKCTSFVICIGAAATIFDYYLPIWFQTVKGASPMMSGIMTLPLSIGVGVSSVVTGSLITLSKRHTLFMILSSGFLAVSGGLLTMLHLGSSAAEWIGYQAWAGIAIGLGASTPYSLLPLHVDEADLASVTALLAFFHTFGSAVAVAVAQAVFQGRTASATANGNAGITDLRHAYTGVALTQKLETYNEGVRDTFYIALGSAGLSLVALGVSQVVIARQAQARRLQIL